MICSEIVLIILAAILMLALVVVYKYQLFAKFTVREIMIPGGTLMFSVYQGNYKGMLPLIEKVKNEISALLPPEERSKAKLFCIYYDDPCKKIDADKCRALVGMILDQKKESNDSSAQKFNAKDFTKNFKSYSTIDFQDLTTFGATFPLYNTLNIVSAGLRGYPAIKKYGVSKNLMDSVKCSMVIYDYPAKEMTICFPYGPSADFILYLSGLPVPVCKTDEETKKNE